MTARFQDYYKVLGVSRKATADEIQRAFRSLARKYHPDVNPGDKRAEERFKAISEAHEVLGDSEKRRRYDSLGRRWKAGQEFTPPWGFGRTAGAAKPRGRFSEFFHTLFGGGREEGQFFHPPPPPPEPPRRGPDVETEIPVTLSQLYHGGTTAIAQRVPDGKGGTTTRKLEVRIPPGVRDGQRIRLAGQGRPAAEKGLPPGDLFLRIHITPHSVFRVRGDDVMTDLPVAPWEAALGAKIRVATLDEAVELTLPAGSQSGQRLRLKGKGLPKANGERGDQYVAVKIVVPKALTGRERELFAKLAQDSPFDARGDDRH
jgi:curved DNA-binding protein